MCGILSPIQILPYKINTSTNHHTCKKLDKTQLKALIDNTESINTETYTDESVNELKAAVEKGNTLLRGVPGQDAIEETYMEIVNAIQGLTKKGAVGK